MDAISDAPVLNAYTGEANYIQAKKDHVEREVRSFIETHVVTHIPELRKKQPHPTTYNIDFVGRNIRDLVLSQNMKRKSMTLAHNQTLIQKKIKPWKQRRKMMVLLLLRANFNDAVKLADGGRV